MENAVSRTVLCTVGLHLFISWVFLVIWLYYDHPTLEQKEIILFKTKEYQFLVDFYFDKISAVYLFVGSALTFLVTQYCRWYLHRESGYKRFFNVILFFYIGYNIIIFSGNFETLFVGWEILGFSSFLLIGFYRDRYLPVKNALKVFTVFRIADMSLLIAMWMNHYLWHKNISFSELADKQFISEHLQNHPLLGILISLMILLAAAVKSGQLPFSSWVPRAMEGPTPSSAIFYGSLSVHLGAFLLLRTFPFWENLTSIVITVIFLGFKNQEQMPAVYNACDVFVLPSKGPNETWGLSINEAMAAGRTIIASDKCGASYNLIKESKNGFVFKWDDSLALKNIINFLGTNKTEVKRMGLESAKIIKQYSFLHGSEAIEKLFKKKQTINEE